MKVRWAFIRTIVLCCSIGLLINSGCTKQDTVVDIVQLSRDNVHVLDEIISELAYPDVVWIYEDAMEGPGVQEKLRTLYDQEVRLIFIRGTMDTNTVTEYLGLDYWQQYYPRSPHPDYVGVVVCQRHGELIVVDIFAPSALHPIVRHH